MHNRFRPATGAIALIFLAVILAGAIISGTRGQDHGGHAQFHEEFYRKWKQPGSDASCCNARKVQNGFIVGDCEPTEAEIRNGDWWARLPLLYRQYGDDAAGYIKVPEDKRIRERNPTQGGVDAHLCWSIATGVLCFVPPDTGM
jgi:hypothetical protein